MANYLNTIFSKNLIVQKLLFSNFHLTKKLLHHHLFFYFHNLIFLNIFYIFQFQFEKQTLNVDSFISAQSNILTEFDNHLFCNSHLTCSHKDAAIWSILMYDFTISLKWIISCKSLLSRPSIRNDVASRMSSERFSSKNTYSSQPNKLAAFSSNPIGISRSPLS